MSSGSGTPLLLLNSQTLRVDPAKTNTNGSLQIVTDLVKRTDTATFTITAGGPNQTVEGINMTTHRFLCIQISTDSNNDSTVKIETSPDNVQFFFETTLFNNSGTYFLDKRFGSNYVRITLTNTTGSDQTYNVSLTRSN